MKLLGAVWHVAVSTCKVNTGTQCGSEWLQPNGGVALVSDCNPMGEWLQ